jgi:hypothetical protein
MESRNITLTKSGEEPHFSPRDRKAVSDIADFLALTEQQPPASSVSYPIGNLVDEIVSDKNLESSFNRVLSNLRQASSKAEKRKQQTIDGKDYTPRQIRYVVNKAKILSRLKQTIGDGSFRVTHLKSFQTKDGPKIRTVQAPHVVERMGCNAIMEVVEQRLTPILIQNTASAIKGRGPHSLFQAIKDAIADNPKLKYFYQSDYRKYYDSINHDRLIGIIRRYISDEVILPMLCDFVKALNPDGDIGISKGLRSSQFYGNLYHNDIDHAMIEKHGVKYYFRFCDDIFILGETKKELWEARRHLHEESSRLGLTIKSSERVAPISTGMDALGYVNYGDHARLRKRTKQKAARQLAKVKSRKRRQQIIGSFKGMACHADCSHLFYKLTGRHMRKFSELGVTYTPADGKKRFPGKIIRLAAIQNKKIEVHDFEVDLKTSQGEGRYLVSFKDIDTGEWGKFFTASDEMKNLLDQITQIEDGLPFETTIVSEIFDGCKQKYLFT